MLGTIVILFRGNSSSELNLIFIYFSSKSSEFSVIDLIKSLILLQSSSYLFIFPLLSIVGISVKYLLPLIFSNYPFTLPKIRFKGFTFLNKGFKFLRILNHLLSHIQCSK